MPAPGIRNTFVSDGGGSSSSTTPYTPSNPVAPTSGVSASGGYGGYYDMLRAISEANNAFNLAQVEMVNNFNAHEAQKNRDWQERMARNAHRYEVEDLIAAGLNPVLSSGGQGAYVGSGAVASGQKAVADNILGNGMISLMQSAMAASSAERVAQIYASASMYGHDVSRYGHNLNYQTQANYQQVLRDNNLTTNQTSASNNTFTNYMRLIGYMLNAVSYTVVRNKFRR